LCPACCHCLTLQLLQTHSPDPSQLAVRGWSIESALASSPLTQRPVSLADVERRLAVADPGLWQEYQVGGGGCAGVSRGIGREGRARGGGRSPPAHAAPDEPGCQPAALRAGWQWWILDRGKSGQYCILFVWACACRGGGVSAPRTWLTVPHCSRTP
jgi:hypothetical protein